MAIRRGRPVTLPPDKRPSAIMAQVTGLVPVKAITLDGWQCLHCGHKWRGYGQAPYQDPDIPAKARRPRKCPQCWSARWYKPRVRKMREGYIPAQGRVNYRRPEEEE